jgi:hypothetical protein
MDYEIVNIVNSIARSPYTIKNAKLESLPIHSNLNTLEQITIDEYNVNTLDEMDFIPRFLLHFRIVYNTHMYEYTKGWFDAIGASIELDSVITISHFMSVLKIPSFSDIKKRDTPVLIQINPNDFSVLDERFGEYNKIIERHINMIEKYTIEINNLNEKIDESEEFNVTKQLKIQEEKINRLKKCIEDKLTNVTRARDELIQHIKLLDSVNNGITERNHEIQKEYKDNYKKEEKKKRNEIIFVNACRKFTYIVFLEWFKIYLFNQTPCFKSRLTKKLDLINKKVVIKTDSPRIKRRRTRSVESDSEESVQSELSNDLIEFREIHIPKPITKLPNEINLMMRNEKEIPKPIAKQSDVNFLEFSSDEEETVKNDLKPITKQSDVNLMEVPEEETVKNDTKNVKRNTENDSMIFNEHDLRMLNKKEIPKIKKKKNMKMKSNDDKLIQLSESETELDVEAAAANNFFDDLPKDVFIMNSWNRRINESLLSSSVNSINQEQNNTSDPKMNKKLIKNQSLQQNIQKKKEEQVHEFRATNSEIRRKKESLLSSSADSINQEQNNTSKLIKNQSLQQNIQKKREEQKLADKLKEKEKSDQLIKLVNAREELTSPVKIIYNSNSKKRKQGLLKKKKKKNDVDIPVTASEESNSSDMDEDSASLKKQPKPNIVETAFETASETASEDSEEETPLKEPSDNDANLISNHEKEHISDDNFNSISNIQEYIQPDDFVEDFDMPKEMQEEIPIVMSEDVRRIETSISSVENEQGNDEEDNDIKNVIVSSDSEEEIQEEMPIVIPEEMQEDNDIKNASVFEEERDKKHTLLIEKLEIIEKIPKKKTPKRKSSKNDVSAQQLVNEQRKKNAILRQYQKDANTTKDFINLDYAPEDNLIDLDIPPIVTVRSVPIVSSDEDYNDAHDAYYNDVSEDSSEEQNKKLTSLTEKLKSIEKERKKKEEDEKNTLKLIEFIKKNTSVELSEAEKKPTSADLVSLMPNNVMASFTKNKRQYKFARHHELPNEPRYFLVMITKTNAKRPDGTGGTKTLGVYVRENDYVVNKYDVKDSGNIEELNLLQRKVYKMLQEVEKKAAKWSVTLTENSTEHNGELTDTQIKKFDDFARLYYEKFGSTTQNVFL